MKSLYTTVLAFFALSSLLGQATYEAPDPDALERIYVERYYISDADDACDTDGGELAIGSVTYRVYADMKPGYKLETIYGNIINGSTHGLSISTSTTFFNNTDRGETQGGEFELTHVNDNTVALDSYLAFGYSVKGFYALPKDLDEDGSTLGGSFNDGGSCSDPDGLLANDDPLACEPMTISDGMYLADTLSFLTIGITDSPGSSANTLHMFDNENSPDDFFVDNGAWAALGGLGGVTQENMILIGQFTTDGIFSFELNMRVGIPVELQCDSSICASNIDYFAQIFTTDTAGLPQYEVDRQIHIPSLVFDSSVDMFACTTVGLVEETLFNAFTIRPNPVREILTIDLSEEVNVGCAVMILDSQGRPVLTEKIGRLSTSLDISELPSGMYIVELVGEGVSSAKRFIKE